MIISIHGTYGTGKSFLATVLASYLNDLGKKVCICSSDPMSLEYDIKIKNVVYKEILFENRKEVSFLTGGFDYFDYVIWDHESQESLSKFSEISKISQQSILVLNFDTTQQVADKIISKYLPSLVTQQRQKKLNIVIRMPGGLHPGEGWNYGFLVPIFSQLINFKLTYLDQLSEVPGLIKLGTELESICDFKNLDLKPSPEALDDFIQTRNVLEQYLIWDSTNLDLKPLMRSPDEVIQDLNILGQYLRKLAASLVGEVV